MNGPTTSVQDPVQARRLIEIERWRREHESAMLKRLSGRQKRCLMKHELLTVAPYCVHCGRQLVAQANNDNSAHLVRKRLSCPEHVQVVRKAAPKPVDMFAVVDLGGREICEGVPRGVAEGFADCRNDIHRGEVCRIVPVSRQTN
jgi:hypothetical protein